MSKKRKTMSVGEIIFGIISMLYGIPSAEEAIGKAIQESMKGFWYYFLGFVLILLSLFGFLALIDGIMRYFSYSLNEFVNDAI